MKAANNITVGKRIERLQEIPMNKVVKLYGMVSGNLAGKDVVIKGHYTNAQGTILLVQTASSPVNTLAVQAYGKTGIGTYLDQDDANKDFSEKVSEYKAAFDAHNWETCKELKAANG